jgi:hypothetical protein
MKTRTLALILIALVFTLFFLNSSSVLAQDKSPVRVIQLSASGYERGHALAFSTDGEYFAVGGISGAYVYDFEDLSEIKYIQTNTWVRSLSFLPGSNRLAGGLFDNTIKTWNVGSGDVIQTLEGHQGWVRSISISDDGSLIASASDDNTLRVWDVQAGTPVLTIDKDTTGIRAAALSPDGKLVAAALGDNTVRVWSVPDGKLVHMLVGHTGWVRCLAFSPDGSLLASGAFDKTVRLWDISDGKEAHLLEGHDSSVLSVAFSPDGSTLASGSVDQTVRLWQVQSGEALQVLRGHTDFVYAVAFSPDGKTLASGGGDNSVRIWDMEKLNDIPSNYQEDAEDGTPSDCRVCHHPLKLFRPARVIELNCTNCHLEGASLSWCPFIMEEKPVELDATPYQKDEEAPGLPVSNRSIAVLIASPGNGETLYVKGDKRAPETISGQVYYSDMQSITSIEVQIDIMIGDQLIDSLIIHPGSDGTFSTRVHINPNSKPIDVGRGGGFACTCCHVASSSITGLPLGYVHILVTATAPNGNHAIDDRWFYVDSSRQATVPIQVIDDATGEPIPNLMIQANTTLYTWRSRTHNATSDEIGNIQLNLESLSEATTSYTLSVPTQVANGYLYSSDETIKLTLEPGKTLYPQVELHAHGRNGNLTGRLIGEKIPTFLEGSVIWAVRLPAGPAYRVLVSADNTFTFDDLPIDQYLIVPDLSAPNKQDLIASGRQVNLLNSPQTAIELEVTKSPQVTGKVISTEGKALRFAWVTLDENSAATQVDPVSGNYIISDSPSDVKYLTVSAPGYYSLSQLIDPMSGSMDFQLVPKPETQQIPWGAGEVFLPSETNARVNGLDIELERGWLWGNGSASQPLHLLVLGFKVDISQGEFALENPPIGTSWLYLYDGKALVTNGDDTTPVELNGGEMIALIGGTKPIPMNPSVAAALHPRLVEAPVPEINEPSSREQFRTRLVKAGISAAQAFTIFAYGISMLSLIGIPLLALMRTRKRTAQPSINGK